jgi:fibro-slime domain-containing protein
MKRGARRALVWGMQIGVPAVFLCFLAAAACASSGAPPGGVATGGAPGDGSTPGDDGGSAGSSSGVGSLVGDGGSIPSSGDDGGAGPGNIHATIRDFRFYASGDPSTDPDFENPPYNIDANGNPAQGYSGPWDDHAIVTDQLGADGTPVYAGDPTAGTLTTYGSGQPGDAATQFQAWYHDVPGTNIKVDYPLPIVQNADGSYAYDSEQQGALYVAGDPTQGRGFFPIDDGTPYATPFGNQGKPHNYSFTMEIHTVFSYHGGEYFNFRGDDDVFVYIAGKLVINLGGVHGPEPAQVQVDSLGLTKGQQYPLDFFSAERHVVGSNILFQTTLGLRAPAQ